MPTYEYRCKACGHEFERFHSMTADPVKDCPNCEEKGSVDRLISGGSGLIFKGSGFYITDYRSESYKNAAKSDKGGAETSSSASSDSKPASESKSSDSKSSDSKSSDSKPTSTPATS